MASRFSVEAVFKGIDRISRPVSRMANRIGKFTRKARVQLKALGSTVVNLGKKFTKILGIGAAGALLAMNLALADGIKKGAEFEQTIVNAAAKFPGEIRKGTVEFKALEEAAKRTGKTTEFTATQSAGAINFLAMAGFNAKQAIAALPGVVDLATASSMDLARATDIATDTLGAFGLASKDPIKLSKNLARVNDVLAKTTTTSNTNMEQLFESIAEGGPVAKAAGASIETFASLTGTLANAGIKGSRAGTTLKNVFIRLSAATGASGRTLRRLGVKTKKSNGDLRDVTDILGDLDKSLAKFGTAQRAEILNKIFGRIPIAGVNVLLAAGSKKLQDYRTKLEGAQGASAKMAATMRDTLKGQVFALKSAFEGLQLTIFDLAKKPMKKFVEEATGMVRSIDTFVEKNPVFIEVLASIAKNTLIVIGALAGLAIVIGIVNLIIAANPIVLIVLAIIALIIIVKSLIENWKKLKPLFQPLADFADRIISKWQPVKQFFKDLFADINEFWAGIVKQITNVEKAINDFVRDKLGKISGVFKFLFNKIGGEEPRKPAVTSPTETLSKSIEESKEKSELIIRDETGRAELKTKGKARGTKLVVATSGAF